MKALGAVSCLSIIHFRHPGLDPGPAFLPLNVEKTRRAPGQARGDDEWPDRNATGSHAGSINPLRPKCWSAKPSP